MIEETDEEVVVLELLRACEEKMFSKDSFTRYLPSSFGTLIGSVALLRRFTRRLRSLLQQPLPLVVPSSSSPVWSLSLLPRLA